MKKKIQSLTQNEIVINKSRFITYLLPIDDESLVKGMLSNYRKKYYDATHVVYAYIINNSKKSSDDKEPSLTAGKPTLNLLEKEDIVNTLCITIRYFGGIKLGTGGLARAYTSSCKECLDKAVFLYKRNILSYSFSLSYQDSSKFDSKNFEILSMEKNYEEDVNYLVSILKEQEKDLDELLSTFMPRIKITMKKEDEIFI